MHLYSYTYASQNELEGSYVNEGFMNGRATWYNEKQKSSIWYKDGRWHIGQEGHICSRTSGIWTDELDPWYSCPHWTDLEWHYYYNGYSNYASNDVKVICIEP